LAVVVSFPPYEVLVAAASTSMADDLFDDELGVAGVVGTWRCPFWSRWDVVGV
jgi:hypothetical protein